MPDTRIVENLDAAAELDPEELYPVRGSDLKRWAEERARAVESEREACARIAENRLGRLLHGHGASGEQLIMGIIEEIRGRSKLP